MAVSQRSSIRAQGVVALVVGILPVISVAVIRCLPESTLLYRIYRDHPLWCLQGHYFIFVNLVFYAAGLAHGNFWLIDLYWSLAPLLIDAFYATHPSSVGWMGSARSLLFSSILLIWSVRLTHNYLRREQYQLGVREDWRYADMRRQWGASAFRYLSFVVVFLVQQPMIAGFTLPLAPIHMTHPERMPFHPLEALLALGMVASLLLAAYADNTLHRFMAERRHHRHPRVLTEGPFAWLRRPNYLGEMSFWLLLGAEAVWLGYAWMSVGAIWNAAILVRVVSMTETRILARPQREAAYRRYMTTTPALCPYLY